MFWDVVKCPNVDQLKGKMELIKESIEAYGDLMSRFIL